MSHSHANRDEAVKLQHILTKYSAETYLDQDRIQVADVLPDRIREGIEWCSVFLLLWSSYAATSAWVDREWEAAYDRRKKIVPYCLDATPLPPALENLVYVDRQDQEHSNSGLLQAVFGRGFQPPSFELFPGHWRVVLDAMGMSRSTYDLELRPNGQVDGTCIIDAQSGMIGELLRRWGLTDGAATQAVTGLLNRPLEVSGTWSYEETAEILILNVTYSMLGQVGTETVHIRTTGRETGDIHGQDFAGRTYVLTRMPSGPAGPEASGPKEATSQPPEKPPSNDFAPSEEATFERMRTLVAEVWPNVDESSITRATSFGGDLRADSDQMDMVCLGIAEYFGLPDISEEDTGKIKTVGDAVRYIRSKRAK